MRAFLQLYRSLSLAQLLVVEGAWVVALSATYFYALWRAEAQLRAASGGEGEWAVTAHWNLGALQVGAVVVLLLAPAVMWIALRDRTAPRDGL